MYNQIKCIEECLSFEKVKGMQNRRTDFLSLNCLSKKARKIHSIV